MTPEIVQAWPQLFFGLTSLDMASIPLCRLEALKSRRVFALCVTVQIINCAKPFGPITACNLAYEGFSVAQLVFPIKLSSSPIYHPASYFSSDLVLTPLRHVGQTKGFPDWESETDALCGAAQSLRRESRCCSASLSPGYC